jgi:hypothetical protein
MVKRDHSTPTEFLFGRKKLVATDIGLLRSLAGRFVYDELFGRAYRVWKKVCSSYYFLPRYAVISLLLRVLISMTFGLSVFPEKSTGGHRDHTESTE